MYTYAFTYYCPRLTNSLSITVEADSREDADDLVVDVIQQAEALGIRLPLFHTFDYVVKREL